jgi:hypothetical protein
MPKPYVEFVTPPLPIHFTSGVTQQVTVTINPLSPNTFHVIFILDYEPLVFAGTGTKTLEFFPVQPIQPYSPQQYTFDIGITKHAGSVVTEELTCVVISDAGKAVPDDINIIVH